MLTWNVTYHCKKGRRAAFYQALCTLGTRANSRSEAGNRRYDVESWESPENQQAHCETEIFRKLQALKAEFCDSVEIEKFNV